MQSKLDKDYKNKINANPNKKFILYVRYHPDRLEEIDFIVELEKVFGQYKELKAEKLLIFIVLGKNVNDFIEKLNLSNTQMYLAFIQDEEEI